MTTHHAQASTLADVEVSQQSLSWLGGFRPDERAAHTTTTCALL